MGPSKSDNVSKKSSTVSNVSIITTSGDRANNASPLPEKKPLPSAAASSVPSPVNVITIDGHKVVGNVSWTQQVPEKIKTVLWNIKNNSTALVHHFFVAILDSDLNVSKNFVAQVFHSLSIALYATIPWPFLDPSIYCHIATG